MNKYPHFFWNTSQFDNYLDLHQLLNQALNKLSDTENYLDPSILNNQQQNGEPILKEKSKFQLWEQYPSSIQKRAGKIIYRIDQQEQKRDQFKNSSRNSKQDNIDLLQNYSEKKIRSMNKIQHQNQSESSKLYEMNSNNNKNFYSETQFPSKQQSMSKLTPLKQFSLSFYKPSLHQSLNKNSSLSYQMKVQSTQVSPFPTDRMSEQNKSNDDSILNIQSNENKNDKFSISPKKNRILKKERNFIQNNRENEISVQKTSQNIKNSTIQNSQIDYQKFGNLSIEQIQKGFDFVHINNTLKFIKEVDDYRQKIYKQVNSSQQNQESQAISRIKDYKVKQIMRSSEKKKTKQVLTLIPQCVDINKSFQQNQNQEKLQNNIFYNQKHENQPLISQFIPHQNQEQNNIDKITNQNSQIIYSSSKSKNYNSTFSRNNINNMQSKNINKNLSKQNSNKILDKKDLESKSYQNSLNNSQNQFIHQQLQQKYKDNPNRQIYQEPNNYYNCQASDKLQEQTQKNLQSSQKILNNCQLTNNSIQFEQDPQIHIKDQKKKTQILLTDRDNQSILSQDPGKFMGQVIKPGNPQLQQKFLNCYFNSNNQQQRRQQSKYQSMQFKKQLIAKSTPLTRSTTPQQNFSANQQKMVILPLPQNFSELDPYQTDTQFILKNENLEVFNNQTNFNQAIQKQKIQTYSSKNLIKYFSKVKNKGTQDQGLKYKFELQQDKCDTKNTQNLKFQGQKQQIENSLFFDEFQHKNAKQMNVNNKKHINILQKRWNKNSTILENFPLKNKQSNN
ncbi:hypothetical protein PPERSA_02905 [Pseudocohnilembus persalinus]|uniref:Uncharacterized protein n=1 Tax=Pseudocohnilembus persalinus TaxID=266149 RepID=A0A0V0QMS2_PSEPJ|nr:hypothetical protein PPERSA_02905 [Pseudocohnilembus persalinus]|eukprot:KRX03526.1 hypothetical protein PPERSA_02905 [Pseudocohnilembus persalinus]